MSSMIFIHCLTKHSATQRGAMRIHWVNAPGLNATLCQIHPTTKQVQRIVLHESHNQKTRIVDASKLHLEDSFGRIHGRQKPANDNQPQPQQKTRTKRSSRFFEMDVVITPNESQSYDRSFQLSVDIAYAKLSGIAVRASELENVNGTFQTRLMLSDTRFHHMLQICEKLAQRYPTLRFDYTRVREAIRR